MPVIRDDFGIQHANWMVAEVMVHGVPDFIGPDIFDEIDMGNLPECMNPAISSA